MCFMNYLGLVAACTRHWRSVIGKYVLEFTANGMYGGRVRGGGNFSNGQGGVYTRGKVMEFFSYGVFAGVGTLESAALFRCF